MNKDPWMQPRISETFNAYVSHLATGHDEQTLAFIRDRSKLGYLWPDLHMLANKPL
jgi:hypothetical protein